MASNKNKLVHNFIIGTFVSLYILVSVISTIHVVDFFELSNPKWMAITLAIGFELGAAASLASLVVLDKMNKTLIWALFIAITLMQIQGNMYYAFKNIESFEIWAKLFNIMEWELLAQKRMLAGISGAILPLIALGFIKSLVDYIKPEVEEAANEHLNTEGEGEVGLVEDLNDYPEFEGDELPSFKDIDDLRAKLEEGINSGLAEVDEIEQRLVEVDEIEPPIEVDMTEPMPVPETNQIPIEVELHKEEDSTESEIEQIKKARGSFDPKQYNSFKKVGKDWIS
jgi:hypothetical protein